MMLEVVALDHLVLNVADPQVSARWYVETLGMSRRETKPENGGEPRVSVTFGAQKINLRPASASQAEWFTGRHVAVGSGDLCFLTEAGPEAVVSHLRACGVAIERGPVEKQGARGVLISIYCRDPDGSLIEISSYAPQAN